MPAKSNRATNELVNVFRLDTITPHLRSNRIFINASVLPVPIADLIHNSSFSR